LIFQAVAFFASLPFLVANGLSISHLSFFGNMILNPVIFIFMFIGAMIFFVELLGFLKLIYLFNYCLEAVCRAWHYFLVLLPIDPLFNLSINHALILFFLATIIFGISCFFKLKISQRLLILYFFVTVMLLGPIKTIVENVLHNNTTKELVFSKGMIIASRDDQGEIYILSPKNFKKNNRRSGFLDFDLKPTLAREFGKTTFIIKD
jgi:hypothetical protein